MATATADKPAAVPTADADWLPLRRRFSRPEYMKMAELGFFRGQRVELIEGEIVTMAPADASHNSAVDRVLQRLLAILPSDCWFRCQMQIDIGDSSAPEPDLSIYRAQPGDFDHRHPQSALLAFEVSKTSLTYDRKVKARLYARAGIAEYWVVDLKNRCVHRYRQITGAGDDADYAEVVTIAEHERISPLFAPEKEMEVAGFFPAAR